VKKATGRRKKKNKNISKGKDKSLTLSRRVGRNVIRARCGAADSVGRPGGVRQQRLAKSRKGALELARQCRQIVDHQRELEKIKNKRKTANQQLAMDGENNGSARRPNNHQKIIKKKIYTVRAVVRWSWLGVTEVMVVHLPLL
jgi:hypothetical protein